MFICRGRLPETEKLFDLGIDPAQYEQRIATVTDPQSRFVIENGHFGGLVELSTGLYFAARIPRSTPEPWSRIADATLNGFATLEIVAACQRMQYTPLPSYKLANQTFGNSALNARTRYRAAEFIVERADQRANRLDQILQESAQQDDQTIYDTCMIVDGLFGTIRKLNVELLQTKQLLQTSRKSLPQIDPRIHTRLVAHFNQGVEYLVEACEMPPVEVEETNTIFENVQHTICCLRNSRDLVPPNRAKLEQLTLATVVNLANTLTRPQSPTPDESQYLASFADYLFLDSYAPGLVSELQKRRDF